MPVRVNVEAVTIVKPDLSAFVQAERDALAIDLWGFNDAHDLAGILLEKYWIVPK